MNQDLTVYLVITSGATVTLIIQVYWRLTHPYSCSCGYRTVWARKMFAHLQTGHKYVEHQKED